MLSRLSHIQNRPDYTNTTNTMNNTVTTPTTPTTTNIDTKKDTRKDTMRHTMRDRRDTINTRDTNDIRDHTTNITDTTNINMKLEKLYSDTDNLNTMVDHENYYYVENPNDLNLEQNESVHQVTDEIKRLENVMHSNPSYQEYDGTINILSLIDNNKIIIVLRSILLSITSTDLNDKYLEIINTHLSSGIVMINDEYKRMSNFIQIIQTNKILNVYNKHLCKTQYNNDLILITYYHIYITMIYDKTSRLLPINNSTPKNPIPGSNNHSQHSRKNAEQVSTIETILDYLLTIQSRLLYIKDQYKLLLRNLIQ